MGPIGTGGWRHSCGGLLDLQHLEGGDDPGGSPITRLPATAISLGEGRTPLLAAPSGEWVKCDFVMPTGSFKDRGTAVMMSVAADLGVKDVVADSSGNGGRSVAAYAARAGMRATVYVPDTTPAERVAAIEDYGATVIAAGDRAGAATAAQAAVGSGRGWYASHVYQPSFVHGVKTLAFELWEQLGRGGPAPATVVVPAGNGTLVMGLWLGFRELGAAPVPRLVAVQAERCAPLAGRLPAPAATGPTAATGIAIARPPRAGPVLAAVRASRGWVVTVSEEEIAAAGAELARSLGVRVEPSAAAAWAGRPGSRPEAGAGPVVVVLTGAPR